MNKFFTLISATALTGFIVTSALTADAQAQEKTIAALAPQSSWSVKAIGGNTDNGYCALSRSYAQNLVLTLGQNIRKEYSLAIDFVDGTLNTNKAYGITLQPGPGQIRAYEMMPASARALVVRLGYDDNFLQSLRSSGVLKAEIDGKQYHFDVSEFAKAQQDLMGCMQKLSGSPKIKTAQSDFSAKKIEDAPPMKKASASKVEEMPKAATTIKKPDSVPDKPITIAKTESVEVPRVPESNVKKKAPAKPIVMSKVSTQVSSAPEELVKEKAAEAEAARKLEAEKVAAQKTAEAKAAEIERQAQEMAQKRAEEEQKKAKELAAKKLEEQKLAAEKAAEAEAARKLEAEKIAAQKAAEEEQKKAKEFAAKKLEEQKLAAEKAAEAERQAALEEQKAAEVKAAEIERQAQEMAQKRAEEEQEKAKELAAKKLEEKKMVEQNLAAEKAAEAERQAALEVQRVAEQKRTEEETAKQLAEQKNVKKAVERVTPETDSEVVKIREEMKALEKENRQLYMEAKEAQRHIDMAIVNTGNDALKKIREYEKKYEAAQMDNLALSKEIEELRRIKEDGRLESIAGDWDLEKSTKRYNEAEREIKRLGMLLEQQRSAHRQEKIELEGMLFDPAVTDQEQRRRLTELELKLARAEKELQASGRTIPSGPSMYDRQAGMPSVPAPAVPRAPVEERGDIVVASSVSKEPVYSTIPSIVESQREDRSRAALMPVERQRVSRASAEGTVISATPVVPQQATHQFNKSNIQQLLNKAGIGVNGMIAEQGAGQYHWNAGQLLGQARVQKGNLNQLVQSYLAQEKQSCAGDFASLPASNIAKGSAFEVACITPTQSTSSSVIFTQKGDEVIMIGHKISADDMDVAIDARDRIAGTL